MKKVLLSLIVLVASAVSYGQSCSNLFFSEYIEGSSNNKALEIYNPTSASIDLSGYEVQRFNNGGVSPSGTLNFPSGTMIAAGDVYVIANPSADTNIMNVSDTSHSITFFNGDDAIILIDTMLNDTLDAIGEVGVDPGASWPVGTGTTQNFTLVRMISIQEGETDWSVGATQWDVFTINTFDSLGMHSMTPCAPAGACSDLFFSEYIEGSSSNKALEIYNPTSGSINLTDYVVYRNNNGSLTPTDSLFPQGTLAAGNVFIVGNPGANATILGIADTTHSLTFYNGDDAVWLKNTATGDTLDIIGQIGVDPGSGWTVGAGATNNTTLIRMINVQQGETDWALGATQWDTYPIDMVDSLGMHTMTPCGAVVDPTVNFSITTQSVNESVGTVTVTVNIANENSNPTSVDVVLNVGSSTATGGGTDFTYTSPTTVTFPANDNTPQTVTITIVDDPTVESSEDIVVDLMSATNNANIGGNSTQTITIIDNDFGAGVGDCSDLFFSEYVEGSSNNKALEIFNPTCLAIDMSNYMVQRFTNGSPTASGTYTFPAGTMLNSYDVYVIGNGSATDANIIAQADTTNAATFFNGDDAVALINTTTGDTLDIIGEIGVDPGTNWAVGSGATSEHTLVRNPNINGGTTDWVTSVGQWTVFPQDMTDSLGAHSMTPCSGIPLNAAFSIDTGLICFGQSVNFTNETTGGVCPYNYIWDFGDGNTSTATNPVNVYPVCGVYTVSLIVVDGLGNADTATMSVTITCQADATITSGGTFCTLGVPTNLTAVDGGGVWTGTGIIDSLNGTFDASAAGAGTHMIIYTISGSCGDADTTTIVVNQSANASITTGTTNYCEDDAAVTLTAVDTGGTWMGNGITDANAGTFDPSVAGIGTHTISYAISGTCGDSSSVSITVDSTDLADISYPLSMGGDTVYCQFDVSVVPTINGDAGTFSSSPAGLDLNTSTGEFDGSNSTTGTYTILFVTSGPCPDTAEYELSIDICSSVEDHLAELIDVYPVPTNDYITVSGQLQGFEMITITDVMGRRVRQIPVTASQQTIDVSDLAPGTYTMLVSGEQGIAAKRFILK